MKKSSITLIEVLAVIIIIVVLALVLLPALRVEDYPDNCAYKLKVMGLVFKMYANESEGWLYPRVQGDPPWGSGNSPPDGCTNVITQFEFGPKSDSIYPEYLSDPDILVCTKANRREDLHILEDDGTGNCPYPGFIAHPSASYFYTGYQLDQCGDDAPMEATQGQKAPAQLVAMLEALGDTITDGDPATDDVLNDDIAVAPPNGTRKGDTIRRFSEGIERKFITDINEPAAESKAMAATAVMWDQIRVDPNGNTTFNHKPGGCNVLYMDGHVEFIKYPGEFPAAKGWTAFMSTLSNAKPKPPS